MTKAVIIFFVCALIMWPFVSIGSYYIAGWHRWQKRFRRDVWHNTIMASSVSLVKFGSYNRCISISIDDYGIGFRPIRFLLLHKSFTIPWVQIQAFSFEWRKTRRTVTLMMLQGNITIRWDIAQNIAESCKNHYVWEKV